MTSRSMLRLWACLLALAVWMPVAPAYATTHRLLLGSPEGMLVFEPSTLRIQTGDDVEVRVQGLGPHNLIVEDHPEWSHEHLAFQEGDHWIKHFATAGRYRFWCEPHRFAGMEGLLIVEDG